MCENLLVRTQSCPVKPASVPSTCNQCYDVYISCEGNSKRLHKNVTSSRNIMIIFCSMYLWNTHAENEFSTIGWKIGQRSDISKGMLLTSYFLQRMDISDSKTQKNSNQTGIMCWPKGLIASNVGWLRIRM